MNDPKNDPRGPSDGDGELRQRAEEKARGMGSLAVPEPSPEESLRIVHEMRVHQIELELQNEELRRAQAELEEARGRYFDLFDLAPVGLCDAERQGG